MITILYYTNNSMFAYVLPITEICNYKYAILKRIVLLRPALSSSVHTCTFTANSSQEIRQNRAHAPIYLRNWKFDFFTIAHS